MISVRPYKSEDYEQVAALYKLSELFGGQFDPDRDSKERLNAVTAQSPDSILVAEHEGRVSGTVSLIEDARTAWLFRFAAEDEGSVTALFNAASAILKKRGHKQVLVYAPAGNESLAKRYGALGFTEGGQYSCFWTMLAWSN